MAEAKEFKIQENMGRLIPLDEEIHPSNVEGFVHKHIKSKSIRNKLLFLGSVILIYLVSSLIIIGSLINPNEWVAIFHFIITAVIIVIIFTSMVHSIFKWKYGTEISIYYQIN